MVELKEKPGVLYQIESYEALMVPPIWLVGDPRPRYPSDLNVGSERRLTASGSGL
ncbi:hypothetical protein O77CONTIG1_03988 [Leptolyngbya sp. O-77]|nr:hypothetical protein O77CONTIG1_03988 [Leptolyngbya sp. O-77]